MYWIWRICLNIGFFSIYLNIAIFSMFSIFPIIFNIFNNIQYFQYFQHFDIIICFSGALQGELGEGEQNQEPKGALRAGAFQVRCAGDPGFVLLV